MKLFSSYSMNALCKPLHQNGFLEFWEGGVRVSCIPVEVIK